MQLWMAVIVILIISPLFGLLMGLQWITKSDGTPPPKPLKQPVAIALAVLLLGIFIGTVVWAALTGAPYAN